MIEKFRQRMASVFEVPDEEYSPTVKLGQITLWLMATGFIGGIMPFILKTNHSLLVMISSTLLLLILTAKPILKRCIKHDE